MNNRLYGNLIFELSKEGRKGYSLPKNHFGDYEVPQSLRREQDAALPECDELTVVRHYTNLSNNNFGVDTGFYPLGSCTMKYNPKVDEEMAALPQFQNLHPKQPAETVKGAQALVTLLERSSITTTVRVVTCSVRRSSSLTPPMARILPRLPSADWRLSR